MIQTRDARCGGPAFTGGRLPFRKFEKRTLAIERVSPLTASTERQRRRSRFGRRVRPPLDMDFLLFRNGERSTALREWPNLSRIAY